MLTVLRALWHRHWAQAATLTRLETERDRAQAEAAILRNQVANWTRIDAYRGAREVRRRQAARAAGGIFSTALRVNRYAFARCSFSAFGVTGASRPVRTQRRTVSSLTPKCAATSALVISWSSWFVGWVVMSPYSSTLMP